MSKQVSGQHTPIDGGPVQFSDTTVNRENSSAYKFKQYSNLGGGQLRDSSQRTLQSQLSQGFTDLQKSRTNQLQETQKSMQSISSSMMPPVDIGSDDENNN